MKRSVDSRVAVITAGTFFRLEGKIKNRKCEKHTFFVVVDEHDDNNNDQENENHENKLKRFKLNFF